MVRTAILAVLAATTLVISTRGADAAEDGEQVFRKHCSKCHSVESASISASVRTGGDLGGIAATMDHGTLRAFASGTNEQGFRHRQFKGTDEELQALVDWLSRQKSN